VPIYEYLCEACGRVSEVMQKVTDPAPKICPECGSKKIAKLVSRSAFQLKGGGWYADLYSSAKKKPEAAQGESKAGGTSDKPAAGDKPASSAKPSAEPKPTETKTAAK
jgi:putative FmdB family regulatory protein